MAVKQKIECDLCHKEIKYTDERWRKYSVFVSGPRYTDAAGSISQDQVILQFCDDCRDSERANELIEQKKTMLRQRRA